MIIRIACLSLEAIISWCPKT